jgi:superfamily I DNA and RNA helicase
MMVYIINAQDCNSSAENLATLRNRLFTAITRSKAWVRVLGIGSGMQSLIQEYNTLKDNDFKLHFRYPTNLEREKMSVVHRDMSPAAIKQLNERRNNFNQIVQDIKSGNIRMEDIEDIVKELELLRNKGE